MTVTQCETRFVNLSHHATILVHTKRDKVKRFIHVVNIARWVERIRGQVRDMTTNNRPCHFGGFSNASFGGRSSLGRGHSIKLVWTTFQDSHGTLSNHGAYGSLLGQPSFSTSPAPIGAPLSWSFYHCNSSHQGQPQT